MERRTALGLKLAQLGLGLAALTLAGLAAAPFARSLPAHELPVPLREEAQAEDSSQERYSVIAERNVFRATGALAPAPPPQPPIQPSQLQIELLATLVAGPAEASSVAPPSKRHKARAKRGRARRARPRVQTPPPTSVAILRDVDGKVRTLAAGDAFADQQVRLVGIERGRIIVEHGGKLETVLLREDESPKTAVAAAGRPGAPASIPPVAPRPRTVPVPPPAATPAGAAPSAPVLARSAAPRGAALLDRLVPGGSTETDASGGVVYRVSRVAAGLRDLLQEDDRIRAINGMPLATEGLDLHVQAFLQQGAELRLTVEDASGRAREVPIPRERLESVLAMAH